MYLPLDCIEIIAEIAGPRCFRTCCLSFPSLGRSILNQNRLQYWKHRFMTINIFSDGTRYSMHGKLHREYDLPAVEFADGTKQWWQHGKLHRGADLPALICADGTKQWWQHGELHRDNDLPALICADGTKQWWQHGLCKRRN